MATEWSEIERGTPASAGEAAATGRELTRINLAARRAIEDFQERRRLRELIGDDLMDF
ncbi:MAG: hypothetical protein P8009_09280 [Gammaproteobacteria bacterium]